MSAPAPASPNLHRWERWGLTFVAFLLAVFGGLVVLRSAYQDSRKTDLGVYCRAAWAIRTGGDPYEIRDATGYHYVYPPLFAILFVPFAEPESGRDTAGYLPFGIIASLWYLLSVAFAAFACDRFANAVLPDEPRGSRRWWYARTMPFYITFGGIGSGLARGQVDALLVALFAAGFAAGVASRRITAGAWLGFAACIKIIPAYLGAYFLARRDARGIFGMFLASLVGLVVIPAAVCGPQEMIAMNRKTIDLVLKPGMTGDGDQTRAHELTNDTGTDSQTFRSVIHNWLNPDPWLRPYVASRETQLAHIGLSVFVTLLTLVVAWRWPPRTAGDQLVLFGCFSLLLTLVTPHGHMHYYTFGLPLVAGLWLRGMVLRPGCLSPGLRTTCILAAWGIGTAIPLFPGDYCDWLRERGFAPAFTVALWVYSLVVLSLRDLKSRESVSIN